MAIPNGVYAAVANVTRDPYEQAALLYACAAESGCQSIQNYAGAPAYGPWQIYLPFHPGVTVAEANDPAFAANYIYTHRNVRGCVQDQGGLWKTAPMQAAFNAARCIEGGTPAEPYSAAQIEAGQMAAQPVIQSGGIGATGNGSIPVLSGIGQTANNIVSNIPVIGGLANTAGAVSGLAAMFAHLLDFLSSPDFWISILLVFLGIALVIMGLGKLASNSPVVQQAASAAPVAAMAA